MDTHYIYNGFIYQHNEQKFSVSNRALLFGDCVTEVIRAAQGKIFFFDQHIDNLLKALEILEIVPPKKILLQRQLFLEEVTRIINKNKLFKGLLIRIIVFRGGGSELLPKIEDSEYVIETFADSAVEILPSKTGMSMAFYDALPAYAGVLSNYDTHVNKIAKIKAAKYAQESKKQDALLYNHSGKIVEAAIMGNVYVVKGQKINTPPLVDGCFNDVMRGQILQVAQENGLEVDENTSLTTEFLKQADEIFTASTAVGINWVAALDDKRFYHKYYDRITKGINQLYK